MQQIKLSSSENNQYLSFTVGGEEYGVDILRVREIRAWKPLRTLPDTPGHIIGVMDLRGKIVPVIDLRRRFNQENIDCGPTTVIIVISVESGTRQSLFGIVVDGVNEVLNVTSSDISEAPDLGEEIITRYITGMVFHNERMVILLNIDRMLDPEELAVL